VNKFILLNNRKSYNFESIFNDVYNTNDIIFIVKYISLILLIISFFSYKSNKLYLNTNDQNEFNYTMKNNSLYSLSKYPQISILLYNIEYETKLLNLINNLMNQSLKDIQILFLWKNKTNLQDYNKIKNISLIDKRISIFDYYTSLEESIFNLMNKIKGKFTLLVNKIINFDENKLEKFYNETKGKINNVFEFQSENENLYLIKTKLLSDLLDSGKFIFNYMELVNKIKSLSLPNLNYISIAFCPNNIYTPLTYVSMISILKNKLSTTFISFYLIIPKDYKSKNKDFLCSLFDQFDYFNITFLTMDNRYKKAYVSRRMSKQTYYRFSLGELLPNLDKIIYLDSDVVVYKDLTNLYNLNFNGKFVLGQVTGSNRSKKTGVYNINNGILLFNLYNMRKFKIEEKALKIIKKGKHFFYHDQTLMNDYFKNYIGIFQLEYHIRNWVTIKNILTFNKRTGKIYDNDVFYFSSKYPSIRHFLGKSKPIKCERGHIEDWWFFARQSKFYVSKSRDSEKIFNFSFT
jgi:lipopolysaccharide biosynthesis glycosyltransferase